MARAATMKAAAAAALLLVLVAFATAVAAATTTTTAAQAHPRRAGRFTPTMGLTQCITSCGTTITSCLLDCYEAPSSGARAVLLPVCLLDCSNNAMFCTADCSTTLV